MMRAAWHFQGRTALPTRQELGLLAEHPRSKCLYRIIDECLPLFGVRFRRDLFCHVLGCVEGKRRSGDVLPPGLGGNIAGEYRTRRFLIRPRGYALRTLPHGCSYISDDRFAANTERLLTPFGKRGDGRESGWRRRC